MKYIPIEAWNDFANQYVSDDLCDIAQGLVTTLIILIPEAQMDGFRNSPKYEKLRADYYNLVRQYTDEKISKPDSIAIHIESKEVFDAKYQGSWYNYFR